MSHARFITALGTPLDGDEGLHVEGLEAHLEDQLRHGIDGLLVAGSMGKMQLLRDQTYHDLVRRCVELNAGRAELLVGVGDTALARTLDRIRLVEQFDIDGIVVLTPYMHPFTQDELIDYFTALADASTKPLFLYDLPAVSGLKIEVSTAIALSKHPNIHGLKHSDNFDTVRRVIDTVNSDFRVIVAQPLLIDVLLKAGIHEHLDGMWGIAPRWTTAIGKAAAQGDWKTAAEMQRLLTTLTQFLRDRPVGFLSAYTTLLNARGIPGNYAPRPYMRLTARQKEQLLKTPIIDQLINAD